LTILLLVLFAGAVQPAPGPSVTGPTAEWKRYADCAAAHYADARIVDLKRTAPMKADIMDLGRRYGAVATQLRRTETGSSKEKAFEHAKAYIVERTRELSLRARPDLQPIFDACPKPPD
jgi:hypothetical protein